MITRNQMAKMLNANVGPARMGDRTAVRKHHPVLGYFPTLFTPEQGTILCLNFTSEYTRGGVVQDLSPQENHATLVTPSLVAGGPFTQNFDLNGSSSKATCSSGFDGLVDSTVTVEAWVYPAAGSGQQGILSCPSWTNHVSFYVRHSAGQDVNMALNKGGVNYSGARGTLTYGMWHYLVGVIDVDAGTNWIYSNGELLASGSVSGTSYDYTSSSLNLFHTGSLSLPRYLEGGGAAIRVTNRAKTVDEIREYYYGF